MPSWPAFPLDPTATGFNSSLMLILSYLDPGMGSYAIQIFLATMLGGMFALKQSWAELKVWLSDRFGTPPVSGEVSRNRQEFELLTDAGARQRAHGQSTAKIR